MATLVPYIAHWWNVLAELLKKKPPDWFDTHTQALFTLHRKVQYLPLEPYLGTGKQIIHTVNAFWDSVSPEKTNGSGPLGGYKSNAFRKLEPHSHSPFGKILAVKRCLGLLLFHLVGSNFLFAMVLSSFLKMLHLQQKVRPQAHPLR